VSSESTERERERERKTDRQTDRQTEGDSRDVHWQMLASSWIMQSPVPCPQPPATPRPTHWLSPSSLSRNTFLHSPSAPSARWWLLPTSLSLKQLSVCARVGGQVWDGWRRELGGPPKLIPAPPPRESRAKNSGTGTSNARSRTIVTPWGSRVTMHTS